MVWMLVAVVLGSASAHTTQQAGEPVNTRQGAKDTAHHTPREHSGEHAPRGQGHRTHKTPGTQDGEPAARGQGHRTQKSPGAPTGDQPSQGDGHGTHNTTSAHSGEQVPPGHGNRTHVRNKGGPGTGNNKPHPHRLDALPGKHQGRHPKSHWFETGQAASRTMAKITWSHGTTDDRPAATQSRRGSPAHQLGSQNQATGLRRLYRRLVQQYPIW